MNIDNHIGKSAISSLVLAGIPCFLIVQTKGFDTLIEFLQGLVPPEIVFWYFFSIYFIYAAFSFSIILIKKYFGKVPKLFVKINAYLSEASQAIQGVFLAVAGALLAILPPMLIVDFSLYSSIYTSLGLLLVFGCLCANSFLEALRIKISEQV